MNHNDLPCGLCRAGVYALEAVAQGYEMFGECKTQKAALLAAPRCGSDHSHVCFGARDFIVSTEFPLRREDLQAIRNAA
jgi:hypothetical protein